MLIECLLDVWAFLDQAPLERSFQCSGLLDGNAYRRFARYLRIFRSRGCHPHDLAEVERLLDAGGFWRMPLTDGTNWGGEGNIVYTALEVSDGARSRRLLWRGLGWRQVALADCLLHGPFVPEAIEVVNAAAAYKYKQQYSSDNVGESAIPHSQNFCHIARILLISKYASPCSRERVS